MTTGTILLGIALFAVATAILYAWGLAKSTSQQEDMTRNLLHTCGSKVVKYLKKHGTITSAQAAEQITGVTVRQFWSNKRLTVQNGEIFSGQVIDFLLDQQYIEAAGKDTYRLKK